MTAEMTLVRDPERSVAAAWQAGDDAWRAGYRSAFLAIDELAWKGAGDQASFAAGHQAGALAIVIDPPRHQRLTGISDSQGLVRWSLPDGFANRGWKATVAIDRPQVAVSAQVEHQQAGSWNAVRLAWADKPVVRPGETLRFKALLRDWDGEVWRRPEGTVAVSLCCGTSRLYSSELPVSDVGTIAGEAIIPPGCIESDLRLIVHTLSDTAKDGDGQVIAKIVASRLSPGSLSVVDDGVDDVRAGETRNIRILVHDAAGEPMVGAPVKITLRATDLATGQEVPCTVSTITTDSTGEAIARIPTSRDSELAMVASISTALSDQTFMTTSAWTTRRFPVPLSVELPQRTLMVGNLLRARVRLPLGARIQAGLIRQSQQVGAGITVLGTGGWNELTIPLTSVQQGATILRFTADELGGGLAVRDLPVVIDAAPAADNNPVRCVVMSTTVLPESTLTVTVGTTFPGRDILLLGGTGSILVTQVAHATDPTVAVVLPVVGNWAPNLIFTALAWLPGRGFTTSTRQGVTVLPIDRLLTVAAVPDRAAYRAGDLATITVTVRDWQHHSVADASISVGLVDERLYALGEDRTPDLHDWFTRQRRTWSLAEASAIAIHDPAAQLWRAVARRWSGDVEVVGRDSSRHVVAVKDIVPWAVVAAPPIFLFFPKPMPPSTGVLICVRMPTALRRCVLFYQKILVVFASRLELMTPALPSWLARFEVN